MKCIYCKIEKSNAHFKKEHIIPQAFGKFKSNLTLCDKVCDECNQYFGDELELALARDSIEGILRYKLGIKKPNEFKFFGRETRLKSIITKEGPLKNAFMQYTIKNGIFGVEPIEQIGFLRKDNNEYDFYLLSNFPGVIDKNVYNLKDKKGIFVLCDENKAISILKKIGIPFIKNEMEAPVSMYMQTLNTDLAYILDSIIVRALCKISFNYFSMWNETVNLLDNNFDEIRQFIRYDNKPSSEFFVCTNKPILLCELEEGYRELCHILTIETDSRNEFIISRFSLFNLSTFTTKLGSLSKSPKSMIIKKGHKFNIMDLTIEELDYIDALI